MAAKKMEYTGDDPLVVNVPDGTIVTLNKGDVVSHDLFGGDDFFEPRSDVFKVKKPTRRSGGTEEGGSSSAQ